MWLRTVLSQRSLAFVKAFQSLEQWIGMRSSSQEKYMVQRFVLLRSILTVILPTLFAVLLARSWAIQFGVPYVADRLRYSGECFLVGLIFGVCFGLISKGTTDGYKSIFVGILMVFVTAFYYSLVRQEMVVVVFPSLFYLPGTTLGSSLSRLLPRLNAKIHPTSLAGGKHTPEQ